MQFEIPASGLLSVELPGLLSVELLGLLSVDSESSGLFSVELSVSSVFGLPEVPEPGLVSVIVKLHVDVLPHLSVPVYPIVVVPKPIKLPLSGPEIG